MFTFEEWQIYQALMQLTVEDKIRVQNRVKEILAQYPIPDDKFDQDDEMIRAEIKAYKEIIQ